LLAAMDFFEEKVGKIVTFNQKDKFVFGEKTIFAVPFHEFAE